MGGGIAIAALVALASASADEEPICADRPGLATATCTVPVGIVQVEIGLADWTGDREDGVRSSELVLAGTAMSVGISDRFHVDVALPSWDRVRVSDGVTRERVTGFGDAAIAAKYRVTSDAATVQLAIRPYIKLPTAKRSLGNGKVEGGVIVPVDYAIPGSPLSLTLAPQLDIVADGDGSGYHLATAQVMSIGVALSSWLSAAAEIWGYWDFDPAGTERHYLFGGSAALLLSNDVQLDAGVNLGLNRAAPDIQAYSGIAFRF